MEIKNNMDKSNPHRKRKIVFISFVGITAEDIENKDIISNLWHVLNYHSNIIVGKDSIKIVEELTEKDIYGE